METKKVYLLEDDWNMSIIFDNEVSWLESLRFNLDAALDETEEKYLKEVTEKANKLYEDMESGKKEHSDWVNGWWYSYDNVDVFYQDRNVMLVSHYHQTTHKSIISAYWKDEDTYFTDMNDGACITDDCDDEDILRTLKDIIDRDDVDYQAILEDLKQYWGLE